MIPWVALVLACGAPVEIPVQPASGPSSGYYPITLDLAEIADPADVADVTVAGIHTYGWQVDGRSLTVMVQGAPRPGPAVVAVEVDGEILEGSFRYEPPVDPLFDRFVSFGASLTQGVQSGTPSHRGALKSPSFVVAERAGAYHALPLLVPDLFPQMGPLDIGPPPACAVPNVVTFVAQGAIEVLHKLNDGNGDFTYAGGREDPDVVPYNTAVGGSGVTTILHGIQDDFALEFVANMVQNPHATLDSPPPPPQLLAVEALDPTVIMTTDLYGNDVIAGLVEGNDIDPARLTEDRIFRRDAAELIDRLAGTGAQVFVANLPQPSLLSITQEKRADTIRTAGAYAASRGEDVSAAEADEAARVDGLIAEIDATSAGWDAFVAERIDRYENVHLVDLHGRVAEIEAHPLRAGGETLSVAKFGGLISLDGVHFSDSGYAMLGNLFLEKMDEVLGTDLGSVDLAEVVADDPYVAGALEAGGLDIDACDR